jgi:hypothetical protein
MQYSTNLTDAAWLPEGDLINSSGGTVSLTNSLSRPSMYFPLQMMQRKTIITA